MKSWIRNYYINQKIKRQAPNFDPVRIHTNFDRVGVLLHEKQYADIKEIEKNLKKIGLGSEEIVFKIFRDINKVELEKSMYFCPNDFSWMGNIDKSDLSSFVYREFDLLVNYYDADLSFMRYINNFSEARFKVGFSRLNDPNNQLEIDLKVTEVTSFFQELKKYLLLIKK